MLSLCGCEVQSTVPASGHYEGNLIYDAAGQLISLSITAEISALENGKASIQLKDLSNSYQRVLILTEVRQESLNLDLPDGLSSEARLTKDGDCYASRLPMQVRLCPTTQSLTIEVNGQTGGAVYSLSLDRATENSHTTLEMPRSFTLIEAVNQAFAMEFNTRAEFQRVMQARHLAQNAYLNLLPHLSANSILAVATATDMIGLLGSIGDLAPFLLPSRWLQAKQAGVLSEAEQDAMVAMRADAGVQVEGLAYAYARDQKIARHFEEAQTRIGQIIQTVQSGETAGRFPAGTADMLASVQISMEADAAELDLSIREQRTFFAQALGLINPQAVTGLEVLEPATPVEQTKDLNEKDYQQAVLARSWELRQMDFLIRAARLQEEGTLFSWMDPTGDPSLGLGLGLGEAVAVQSSKVAELLVSRQGLEAILLQKLSNTVAEYNDSMEDHERSTRNFEIQDRRLKRELTALQSGVQANLLDLVTVLPEHLKAQIALRNSEAVYRLSRAKLDRLLSEGFYTHLTQDPNARTERAH